MPVKKTNFGRLNITNLDHEVKKAFKEKAEEQGIKTWALFTKIWKQYKKYEEAKIFYLCQQCNQIVANKAKEEHAKNHTSPLMFIEVKVLVV